MVIFCRQVRKHPTSKHTVHRVICLGLRSGVIGRCGIREYIHEFNSLKVTKAVYLQSGSMRFPEEPLTLTYGK